MSTILLEIKYIKLKKVKKLNYNFLDIRYFIYTMYEILIIYYNKNYNKNYKNKKLLDLILEISNLIYKNYSTVCRT